MSFIHYRQIIIFRGLQILIALKFIENFSPNIRHLYELLCRESTTNVLCRSKWYFFFFKFSSRNQTDDEMNVLTRRNWNFSSDHNCQSFLFLLHPFPCVINYWVTYAYFWIWFFFQQEKINLYFCNFLKKLLRVLHPLSRLSTRFNDLETFLKWFCYLSIFLTWLSYGHFSWCPPDNFMHSLLNPVTLLKIWTTLFIQSLG